MSTPAKIFTVLILIFTATFFGTATFLFQKRIDWEGKYLDDMRTKGQTIEQHQAEIKKLQERELALTKERNTAQSEVQRLGRECRTQEGLKDRFEKDLKERASAFTKLQEDHHQLVDQLKNATEQNKELDTQVADLKGQVDGYRETERDLTAKVEGLQEKLTYREEELEKNGAELMVARKDLADSEAVLEMLKKRVGDDVLTGLVPRSLINGRVLQAAEGIVVINKGRNDGVAQGAELSVFRGDQYVAKIKVTDLQDDMCGARVLRGVSRKLIRKGDNVTSRID